MTGLWTASISRTYETALDQVERALRACPDELWEASLWPVSRHHPFVWPLRRAGDKAPGDEAAQEALLPVVSAFWNVAYHAIFFVDFYLGAGVSKGYRPPAPFRESDHHGNVVPVRTYTRDELLSYVAYARERVHTVVLPMTDEQANSIVARNGMPFGEFVVRNVMHTAEHASQLNLFLSQHQVEPPGGIAGYGLRQYLREGVLGRPDEGVAAFAASVGGYARLLPPVFGGLCANLRPAEDLVVRFDVGAPYFMRAKPGRASMEKGTPKSIDATFIASPEDFLRLMVREIQIAPAIADGRIKLEGDRDAVLRLFETAAVE